MTYDDFLDMLQQAQEAGYISDVHCSTHDGVRTSGTEAEQWEEGFDPCAPVVRLWEPGSQGDEGMRFDEDFDPAELFSDVTVEDITVGPRAGSMDRIRAELEKLIEPELERGLGLELGVARWVAVVEYVDGDGDSAAVRIVSPGGVGPVDAAGLMELGRGLL